jgi:hypothetical protein
MSPAIRCWQVFGLTSVPALAGFLPLHRFPVPEGPVRYVEVVLDSRCGAAPEVRRVPFSAPDRSQEHQHHHYIWWFAGEVNKMLVERPYRGRTLRPSSREGRAPPRAGRVPPNAPGSLTEEQYWDILAFDLKANGIDLGDKKLDAALAKTLEIPRK